MTIKPFNVNLRTQSTTTTMRPSTILSIILVFIPLYMTQQYCVLFDVKPFAWTWNLKSIEQFYAAAALMVLVLLTIIAGSVAGRRGGDGE